MPNRTIHQVICRRTKNGLKYNMPKTITSDIGFQLMFGQTENAYLEQKEIERNADNYDTNTYRSVEHFKRFI
mgnify:CR=1 FL=1|tara:strand:- start:6 stop:221 length:216 start_codon:yes stop_codon:yes gene_type:complete